MDSTAEQRLMDIVDEYVLRAQNGESPKIDEYCEQHPDIADDLRELLDALDVLEDLRPRTGEGEAPDLNLPEQIGDYRIIGEIGRGGMGVVYEADQISLNRRVALKVLPQSQLSSANAKVRFQREARAAAKMHHTNIVPVFEVGREGEHFFYAMQLIDGRGLDEIIDELKSSEPGDSTLGAFSNLSNAQPSATEVTSSESTTTDSTPSNAAYYHGVARIGWQTSDALAYAHERGVIHRDIKPSNLLLDAHGTTWVTDFGLAKMMDNDETLTNTGDYLGTLRYMSPERFKGQCDERADIYALGITLYELAVLRPAFESVDRLKLIYLINNTEPPRPKSIDPNIPLDLETIILKAIEKDPPARFANASELAAELNRFLNDEPIRARRATVVERSVRWARRNKSLAASLLAVMVLSVVSTIGWANQSRQRALAEDRGEELEKRRIILVDQRKELISQRESLRKSRDKATQRGIELQERTDELRLNLYYSEMNIAGQAASSRFGTPTVRAQLAKWTPDEAAGTDLRGWEWYFLHGRAHREKFASEPQQSITWAVDYSPDGTEIVNCVNGFGIQVRDASSGAVLRQKLLGSARYVHWRPDGKLIAVSGFGANIDLCDAQSLELVGRIMTGKQREVVSVQWSPDGKKIATSQRPVGDEKNIVRVFDLETQKLVQELDRHTGMVWEVSWSPDGTKLATAGVDAFRIWNVDSGKPLLEKAGHASNSVCWRPDGKLVAFQDSSSVVGVTDATTGETIAKLDCADAPWRLRWRPGHRQLAFARSNGVISLWSIDSGAKLREFRGHTAAVRDIEWNADGSELLSSGEDGTVRTWAIETGDQTQSIPIEGVSMLEWSSDSSSLIASALWHSRVSHIDAATGKVRTVADDALQVEAATFDSTGDQIAFAGRGYLRVWDKGTGETTELDNTKWLKWVDWSPGGKLWASDLTEGLFKWDPEGPGETLVDGSGVFGQLEISPDGSQIACCETAGVGGFSVWSPTGRKLWRGADGRRINCVRWNSDGTKLASAEEGRIVLWDAESGTIIRELTSIREGFGSVDWSPDESRLVSSSPSSVSIWDPQSGHVAINLAPGTGGSSARWSPDGSRIAASVGNSVIIWDASRSLQLGSGQSPKE